MIEIIKGRNKTLAKMKSRDSWEYNTSVVTVQLAYFLSTDDKVNVVNWEQIFTVYIPT